MAAGTTPSQKGGLDCDEIAFDYEDSDNFINEISELYNYAELSEFYLNLQAFESELAVAHQVIINPHRALLVSSLLNQLNHPNKLVRRQAARGLLYFVQGCWALTNSVHEQVKQTIINVMVLCDEGAFKTLTNLLTLEMEYSAVVPKVIKYSPSIADSEDLRIIFSILYTMVEVIRIEKRSHSTVYSSQVERFCSEIGREPLLVIKLLDMVTHFCSGEAPGVPIKKLVLLIWKLILLSLGGRETVKHIKATKRKQANLSAQEEDTIEIAKTMKSAAPPSTDNQHIVTEAKQLNNSTLFRTKQLVFENAEIGSQDNVQQRLKEVHKGTPWTAKARPDRIGDVIVNAINKCKETNSECNPNNFPETDHQQLQTLKKYSYISLSRLQILKEGTRFAEKVETNPVEILYQIMLPSFYRYTYSLLQIVLATETNTIDTMNIIAEIMPHCSKTDSKMWTSLENEKLHLDLQRHKEVILKAVSSIILLLLQHLKLNHIYQFEFMAQNLVDANWISFIIKFFNQDIMEFIGEKNKSIHKQPEFDFSRFGITFTDSRSRRTIFSCINMARILCKLTKWKSFRIKDLLLYESVEIFCKVLEVRQATLQLYILKLIKMQAKYLGKEWINANLEIITTIYRNVRHHFLDDWLIAQELPSESQKEDNALRAAVVRFNRRRYHHTRKEFNFWSTTDKPIY